MNKRTEYSRPVNMAMATFFLIVGCIAGLLNYLWLTVICVGLMVIARINDLECEYE